MWHYEGRQVEGRQTPVSDAGQTCTRAPPWALYPGPLRTCFAQRPARFLHRALPLRQGQGVRLVVKPLPDRSDDVVDVSLAALHNSALPHPLHDVVALHTGREGRNGRGSKQHYAPVQEGRGVVEIPVRWGFAAREPPCCNSGRAHAGGQADMRCT